MTSLASARGSVPLVDLSGIAATATNSNGETMTQVVAASLFNWFASFDYTLESNMRVAGSGFPPGGELVGFNPETRYYRHGLVEVWVDENGTYTVRYGRLWAGSNDKSRPPQNSNDPNVFHGTWAALIAAILAALNGLPV